MQSLASGDGLHCVLKTDFCDAGRKLVNQTYLYSHPVTVTSDRWTSSTRRLYEIGICSARKLKCKSISSYISFPFNLEMRKCLLRGTYFNIFMVIIIINITE